MSMIFCENVSLLSSSFHVSFSIINMISQIKSISSPNKKNTKKKKNKGAVKMTVPCSVSNILFLDPLFYSYSNHIDFLPDFTVIFAVPFFFAVITPLLLTVATDF